MKEEVFGELLIDPQNNTTTKEAPGRLMMGRALHPRLDFLRPSI